MSALLRHEWRRAGLAAGLAAPVALALTVALGAVAGRPDRLLLAGLEAVVPLALAMAAVSVMVRERLRELHLSLPVPHTATLARRLALVAGGAAVLCLAGTAALVAVDGTGGPGGGPAALIWASPAVFLGGLAVLVTVATRSAAVAATAVGLLWLGEQLFAGLFAVHRWLHPFFMFATLRGGSDRSWLANRLTLLAAGALFLAVAALLLHRPERLLDEEDDQ
ncbi:hypothetical protein [Dactylosporangium matsuzakiense]|uniref:Uncharacterized protein n=1 Tax=Dactylosporangium matsuzakiense TaxID=53360 RepID=A0A9W6NRC2_9ACTN|nr:hypothetical protein [Dactylosporangium matsuzakiense]UWZ48425.1 hypothetical protein Dmats_19645 [Dactylosporangium matsuzakiense]GLL07105.1 hypothetical protein GCM10017581_088570 [Dactylosporangium matsuzakiense]